MPRTLEKTTLDTFISDTTPLINNALKGYSDARSKNAISKLEEAIAYSLCAPGKRIRPLLSIASFLLWSDTSKLDKIMPFSCAIEMIHSYSLIHDDLPAMDDDDFRRGLPTNHKAFGEDIAILAGDALQNLAIETVGHDLPLHYNEASVLRAIQYMTKAFGSQGLIGGQVLDISSHNIQDEALLTSIHTKKTGAVIQTALVVPAILEKAPLIYQQQLELFGRECGLLFQITDDILDATGTKESLGKSPNKDSEQNKLTYVSLYGLEKAKDKAQTTYLKACQHLESITADTSLLKAFAKNILNRSS